MDYSDQTVDITQNKSCSRSGTQKPLSEFIQSQGRSQEREFSICNNCSEKKKGKRISNPEPIDEDEDQDQDQDRDLEEEIDDEDKVFYELAELEELVAGNFTNVEDGKVNFSGIFEFENELIDNDQDNEEDRIHNIIYHFILPIEAGSHYYWEIRRVYLCKKNNQYIGKATVHLGCAQSVNRKKPTQPDRPVKRISEARPPIDRYACEGKIKINIDINVCHAKVTLQHLMIHEHPAYRENKLPEGAIKWISKNLKLRKIEVYKRLCDEQLIDSRVHTYRQVYYWTSKFSAQHYLTDASNQLLSSLNFLRQSELVDEGYKVVLYLENDFVHALGFLTPFNGYVQK